MSYTQLTAATPKARKEHRCTYCGQKILVGETYYRENGVYDGDMQSLAYHPECYEQEQKDHEGESFWEIDPFECNERPTKSNVEMWHR